MKKLYSYNNETEKRIERLEEASSNEVVSEMLAEQLNFTEDMTFGEAMLKVVSYMFGMPGDIWDKHLNELTKEDAEMFLSTLERDCVTFAQV